MQNSQEWVSLFPTMGELKDQGVTRGPTGARVAHNLRRLRDERKVSRQKLAERMEALGRKIVPSGIEKIERQTRRVDVDDLVALALALDVTPNALLLPPAADETETYLTPNASAPATAIWSWAAGERPLRDIWRFDSRASFDLTREKRFVAENRPHAPKSRLTIADTERYSEVLRPLEQAVHAAREAGIPLVDIVAYVKFVDASRAIIQGIRQQVEGDDGGQG